MKIASYNLNGIRSALNKGWLDWLKETEFDVVCVQELKAQVDQIDTALFEAAGYHVYAHAAVKKGYSGVAIFSRVPADHIEIGCGNDDFDKEGRVIRADFGKLSVYSIYFPSGTTGDIRQGVKYTFLDYIYDYLHTIKKTRPNLVVCGDYNIAHQMVDIHDPKSNKNSSGFLPEERAWMDKWFASGFSDGFRLINQEAHQ
jgi:exodeoxyribonuclease-3